jgi:cytochrome c oxidase subunit III
MTGGALALNRSTPERWHVREIGLWMFLGTIFMLFAAFTSAYVVRRSGGDWVPVRLPLVLWLNTAVLLASGVLVEGAKRAAAPTRVAAGGLLAACLLAALFLAGQIEAWRELVATGVYLRTNPASSFFFILTGVHGVHLLAAFVALAYLLGCTLQRAATAPVIPAPDDDWPALAGLVTTFWHFLTAVWIYLLLMLQFA